MSEMDDIVKDAIKRLEEDEKVSMNIYISKKARTRLNEYCKRNDFKMSRVIEILITTVLEDPK